MNKRKHLNQILKENDINLEKQLLLICGKHLKIQYLQNFSKLPIKKRFKENNEEFTCFTYTQEEEEFVLETVKTLLEQINKLKKETLNFD
jgi:hypothetical protein